MRILNEQELWQNALVHIELETSEASFRTWFKGTELVKRRGSDVQIGVPNKITKEWLRDKYHKTILHALRGLDSSIRTIEYVVYKGSRQNTPPPPAPEVGSTIPLDVAYIDKRDNLNPRYTFDTFVVGPFNQLAHAAAQAVIHKPGIAYNPLFIYGETGRGKTHLIQAVGNYIKKTHPTQKVFYVTSERFTVDYFNSLRAGKANNFKNQYRQYDVLIMDDIQFIADKEKTQEELFHLFNAMHDNNKQIIFSSDKHPNNMPGFENRLKGRFSAGMLAEIPEPDFESRITIIQAKAAHMGFAIPAEMIETVAADVRGNIRELEGILNAIMCKTQLSGKPVDYADIRAIIKHTTRPSRGVSVEEVVRKVSNYYDIDERTIYEKTRKKEVVKPRQIIMYILREEFNVSYPSIGEKLGGRDHTTVIHSCEKVKSELKLSPSLEQELDQIRTLIRG